MVLFKPWLRGTRGFNTFPNGIYPKVNNIARLKFDLAYYNLTVSHVNHYTMGDIPFENFMVSVLRTDSKLCIYHLSTWLTLNFLHGSI